MTTTESRYASKARSLRFRAKVIDLLRAAGFDDAASAPELYGASVADHLRQGAGDIIGVPPWVLGVRARETTFDLAAGLDRVRWQAEVAATPYYALVQLRRGHPEPERSTVVMELSTFVAVLKLLQALAPDVNEGES